MSALDRLAACAGEWIGSNRLHDPNTGRPEDSRSTAVLTTVLNGRFIRLDYRWSYQGAGKEGSLLVGYQAGRATVTAHWIDSWHMADVVMSCEGAVDSGGDIAVRGSYAAPPGEDWGWRIVIRPVDGAALHVIMYNISPDGQEELAVEATYARAEPRDCE